MDGTRSRSRSWGLGGLTLSSFQPCASRFTRTVSMGLRNFCCSYETGPTNGQGTDSSPFGNIPRTGGPSSVAGGSALGSCPSYPSRLPGGPSWSRRRNGLDFSAGRRGLPPTWGDAWRLVRPCPDGHLFCPFPRRRGPGATESPRRSAARRSRGQTPRRSWVPAHRDSRPVRCQRSPTARRPAVIRTPSSCGAAGLREAGPPPTGLVLQLRSSSLGWAARCARGPDRFLPRQLGGDGGDARSLVRSPGGACSLDHLLTC